MRFLRVFFYISGIAHVPVQVWRVWQRLRRQRVFMAMLLEQILAPFEAAHDETLGPEDFKKIRRYYGLAVPAILAEGYALLRQQPLSPRERTCATFLGAATGLFDDFFENNMVDDGHIRNLYQKPQEAVPQGDNQRLALVCWLAALKTAAKPELLMDYACRVHDAQIDSRSQQAADVPVEFLQQVTTRKGGYSVLFYMSLFYEAMPAAHEKLYYSLGALLQLENDLFDVYKDSQMGIKTLASGTLPMAVLRNAYLQQWNEICNALNATNFEKKGKAAFRELIAALVARGLVCLDMLQQREQECNGNFQPDKFSRKALICDMEKPGNMLKTIHYYGLLHQ